MANSPSKLKIKNSGIKGGGGGLLWVKGERWKDENNDITLYQSTEEQLYECYLTGKRSNYN